MQLPASSKKMTKEFRRDILKKTLIVCSYWPKRKQLVWACHDTEMRRMLMLYGTDLKIYPDGLSMAVDFFERAALLVTTARQLSACMEAKGRQDLWNG